MKRWECWGLALILVAGLLLRTAYLVEIADAPDFRFPSVDASFHDYWARAIVSGDWEALPKSAKGIDPEIRSHPYFRPPGYSFFLAGVYFLTGSSYLGARIVQMMLGLVNIVLAFFLGRRIFGPGVALVLAGFMSLYWIFIYYEGQLQAPVLLIFLMLILAHVCLTLARKITWSRSAAAGFLMGLQALVRPNILIFAPALLIFEWCLIRKKKELGSFKVLFAGLFLGMAVAVLPVSIRNYAVAGDLVLISSNAGVNLYIGNNEAANGRFKNDVPDLKGFRTSFNYTTVVRRLEAKMERPLKYSEVSRYFTAKVWDFVKEHPRRFIELILKKAALFIGPEEISHNNVVKWDRRCSKVLSRIPGDSAFSLSLALVGCMLLVMNWRGKRPLQSGRPLGDKGAVSPTLLILLLACTYSASFLPFFITALYRVPVTPFLLLFGAYGAFHIGTFINRRRSLAMVALVAALYGAMHLFMYESSPLKEARELATWHFNQAVSYHYGGRIEEAEKKYHEALEIFPEYHDANVQLAVMLKNHGRVDEAVRHFQKAIRIKPDSASAHLGYASVLANHGRVEEAIPHYRKAAALRPGEANVHFILANALAQTGNLEEAELEYAMEISRRPEHAEARCNLGVVLFRQGKVDEAIAMYRSALRIRPRYVVALTNLGMALEKQGQINEAIRIYRRALEIDPKDEGTRSCLNKALSRRDENAPER